MNDADARYAPDSRGSADPRASAGSRRIFLERLGWLGIAAFLAATVPGAIRFLRPGRGAETGGLFDAGSLDEYRGIRVSTRWVKRHRVWVVRDEGGLYALVALCTHLGCTPRWDDGAGIFVCPCHGSQFSPEGVAIHGPARFPLRRAAIRREGSRVMIDPARTATLDEADGADGFYLRDEGAS